MLNKIDIVVLVLLTMTLLIYSCNPSQSRLDCNLNTENEHINSIHPECLNTSIAIEVVQDTLNKKLTAFIKRGGNKPYKFSWSNKTIIPESNESSIVVKENNWYSVTVTDARGDSVVEKIWAGSNDPVESVKDTEGNIYKTVKIGNQIWMAENLKSNLPDSWCFNNKEENCEVYGRLYTWYTALHACPSGWHLPTDKEWKELEAELGIDKTELDENGLRGTDEGGKIKSSSVLWDCPNEAASNSSGFSALPGGPRYKFGMFGLLGHNATFWTATEYDKNYAWFRYVGHSHAKIGRIDNEKIGGHSIRCVKD